MTHRTVLQATEEQPPWCAARLTIVRTLPNDISYRLVVARRTGWSNRIYDRPEDHTGARQHREAWAQRHGYPVIAGKEVPRHVG
jgi:hypothetical protein